VPVHIPGHRYRRSRYGCHQGFTLIELAVVMAIVAIILGTVVSLVTTQLQNVRASGMRTKLDTIKAALGTFVARNSRLPCPAIETRNSDDVDYGVEALNPGVCTGTTSIGTAMRGMVPWKTLGLNAEDAMDVYAGRFTYVVTTSATNLNTNIAGAMGTITLHDGTPPTLGRSPTGNQINACSIIAGDTSCNGNAIVLVLSHGPNGAGAFLESGSQATLPTSARELENTNADISFVLSSASDFDDVLLALAPDALLAPLIRDGAIRSARAITNDNLREIHDALVGAILNDPAGTIPTAWATGTDGWNNAPTYVKVAAATSVCAAIPPLPLPPNDIVFQLYSYGPNRADNTMGGDDIVRTQRAGPLKAHIMKIHSVPCP
jgi:prepilin-type N-terminal cleavage/methylation domain-containing protein